MSNLLFEEESYKIIGICIEIHKKLGNGFSKDVYEEVLLREFTKQEIPFEKKKKLQLFYDGVPLQKCYTADFVCSNKIILNIVCIHNILEKDKIEAINCLKATNFQLGLIINFGIQTLKWKRVINT